MAGMTIIIDCKEGNVNSIHKMMVKINPHTVVTSSPADIGRADKIILPGVGHFQKAVEALESRELLDPLHEAVLVQKKPILGICLGMQIMARSSEEGNRKGLGWMDGEVVRFVSGKPEWKVPHMGWNTISLKRQSLLMKQVKEGTEFYFAHSYRWRAGNPAEVICETGYGISFPSGVEKDNIFGVQFHPEKSHDAGLQVLRNFAAL